MRETKPSPGMTTIRQGRLFKKIWDSVADGVVVTDLNGTIIYSNTAIESLYGYDKQEMLGEDFTILVSEEYQDEVVARYNLRLKGAKLPSLHRTLGQRKDGTAIFVEINNNFIIKQRRPAAVVCIIRDVTLQTIIQNKRQEFLRLARNELKNTLSSLSGYIDLLEKQTKGDGGNRGLYFLPIHSGVDRLNRLIDDILDISPLRYNDMVSSLRFFDYDTFVKDYIFQVRKSSSLHNIILKGKTRRKVVADKTRLTKVLHNLLENAIKYSPDTPQIIVKLQADEECVYTSVIDFGIGIKKANLEKIFGQMARGKEIGNTFEERELGLRECREIVREHGGRLDVTSEPNKGSTFLFTIPIFNSFVLS